MATLGSWWSSTVGCWADKHITPVMQISDVKA
jgi:hypothetical protein